VLALVLVDHGFGSEGESGSSPATRRRSQSTEGQAAVLASRR
jgi:hypothetical protein